MSAVNNSAVSVGNDDLDVNELSEQLSIDMFASLSEFLKATLKNSVDDYHLLAELNTIAASRYASMTERTQAYMAFLAHIKTLHGELAPQLAQIDALEANTQRLYRLAQSLDAFSEQLNDQFRKHFSA